MQNNNIEELEAVKGKEESYGGFQYKHNYDEYKKELMDKQKRTRGSIVLAVVIIIGFVVLLLCLSAFIADTILKTKGSSLSAFLHGGTPAAVIPTKTELSKSEIDEIASKYTVSVSSGSGEGTGIILTVDGYIATSYKLINGASALTVGINGKTYNATLVGSSQQENTAVLKIDAGSLSLTTAEIGYSRMLIQGQEVYCKPFADKELIGLTISDASDSAIIVTEPKCVCPGAPLINSYGQVVGLVSDESGNVLHMDSLLPQIKKLLKDDSTSISVSKSPVFISALGIYVESVSEKQAEVFKIPRGCFVSFVKSSDQFKKGDIIVEIDGSAVTDVNTLQQVISAGCKVRVYRNNAYTEFTMK